VTQPVIIVASLMRQEGATGVQTHMREFLGYLRSHRLPCAVANPFYVLSGPLLAVFILLRKLLERTWKPGAVALYRGGHSTLLALRLWGLMWRHAECVVYAQCPLSAHVALRVRRRATQRVVLVVHFNVSQADEWIGKGMLPRGSWLDRRIRSLESSVVQRVQGLVFVSAFMQREMAKIWPVVPQAHAVVIPNFVKPLADASPLPGMAGRDLVNIGTLEPRKNQRFLLDVLAEARRRGRQLTLTLVGDGPDRVILTQRAQDLGLLEQVRFMGFSAQGRAYIPGHRLYVHSAVMETQGIVLLEAMSAGVPVMAAHVGGIPEVFDDGVQGRYWPLDDVSRACDILLATLDDDKALVAMRAAATERFQACFEAETVASSLYGFLVSLPGGL